MTNDIGLISYTDAGRGHVTSTTNSRHCTALRLLTSRRDRVSKGQPCGETGDFGKLHQLLSLNKSPMSGRLKQEGHSDNVQSILSTLQYLAMEKRCR